MYRIYLPPYYQLYGIGYTVVYYIIRIIMILYDETVFTVYCIPWYKQEANYNHILQLPKLLSNHLIL